MLTKDSKNLLSIYKNEVLKENLGLGPLSIDQASSVVGVTMPDNESNQQQATEMAETEIQAIIKNANDILQELETSNKIEPWITSKITLARDYIQTVLNYISNER